MVDFNEEGQEQDESRFKYRGVASTYLNEWRYAAQRLRPRQDEWTRFHAAYRGEYLNTVFDSSASDVYPKLTRMAVGIALSKLLPVLLPVDSDPWDIEPSEVPDLFVDLMAAQGQQKPQPEEIAQYALAANEKMRARIKDNIEEMGYDTQVLPACLDLTIFGTMVWLGPMGNTEKKKGWKMVPQAGGGYTIKKVTVDDSQRPIFDHVPLRSFYPDPAATNEEDMDYGYIEHVMTASQVEDLKKRKSFDRDEIDELLVRRPNGDYTPLVDQQATANVNEELSADKKDRYRVLQRWGWIRGEILQELGKLKEGENPKLTRKMGQIWICDEAVLMCELAEYYSYPPFVVCPYEYMPGMIFGRGVAEQMEDPQSVMCSLVRGLVDNIGYGVAPMGEVRVDKLAPNQPDPTIITPRRMYATRRRSEHQDDGKPAVTFYNVPIIANEILQAMNFFMNLIQYQTSLPLSAAGMTAPGGSGIRTIGQQTQLYQQSENFIRVVLTVLDKRFITKVIRGMYDWEMEYNKDLSIKGDFQVVARGVQGAMEREVELQRLMDILQTFQAGGEEAMSWVNQPAAWQAISRRAQIKDKIFFTPEEKAYIEAEKAKAQAAQAQLQDSKKFKAQTPFSDALVQMATKMEDTTVAKPAAMAEAYRALGVESPTLYAALSVWAQGVIQSAQAQGAGASPEQVAAAGADFEPPASGGQDKPDAEPNQQDAQQAQQSAQQAVAAGAEIPGQGMAGQDVEEMLRQAMAGRNIRSLPPEMEGAEAEAGGPGEQPQPSEAPSAPVVATPAPQPQIAVHIHAADKGKPKRKKVTRAKDGSMLVEDADEAPAQG